MTSLQNNFTKDNEYYTPKCVVSMFGKFDYDPATTETKAKELNIANFDTIETNGLSRNWKQFNRIWINPPFTNKKDFLVKALETFVATGCDIFFLVPIEFLTTKFFSEKIKEFNVGIKLFIPNGRIKFESGLGKSSKSPAFGSVIFKIQKINSVEFIEL